MKLDVEGRVRALDEWCHESGLPFWSFRWLFDWSERMLIRSFGPGVLPWPKDMRMPRRGRRKIDALDGNPLLQKATDE